MDALDRLYQQPIPPDDAATGRPGGSKLRAAWNAVPGLHLGKGLFGRILFGCLCSVIVGVVTNLPYLKLVVLWICHLVILIFGKPDMPPSLGEKAAAIASKGKEVAEQHDLHIPQAEANTAHPFRAAAAKVEHKLQAKLAATAAAPVTQAAAKAKEQVHEAREEVKEKVEAVGKKVETEAQKISGQMGMAAGGFRDAMIEHQRQAAERRAEAERQAIIQRAVRYHIPWRDRPIDEVRDDVVAAEAKHAPNAQCPSCHLPRRLPPRSTEHYLCPRCQNIYSARRARALGPPGAGPGPGMRSPF